MPVVDDDSTQHATGTKSVERLMAERESLRKQNQENQKYIDELETKLARSGKSSENDDDHRPWFSMDDVKETVRETVNEVFTERERKAQEQDAAARQFVSRRNEWVSKAYEQFPWAKDANDERTKRAKEIFSDVSNDLADASGLPTRPSAEYDAYARAELELRGKKSTQEQAQAAARFAAPGPSGAGGGEPKAKEGLSDEEYLALSPADRVKHDAEEFEKKFGYKP